MADCVLDENVSESLAPALQSLGHDAVTTTGLGRKGATDVSQLSYAARTRRVLITHDARHYAMLHEAWQTWSRDWGVSDRVRHPGILFLPDPGILSIEDAPSLVDDLLSTVESVENHLFAWKRSSGWLELTVTT